MLAWIVLATILLVQRCDTPSSTSTRIVPKTVVLPPDTVYVERVEARVRYRTVTKYDTINKTYAEVDTFYTTRPFTASIDTSIGCSRVKLDFKYPEFCFENIMFVSCSDTVVTYDTVSTVVENDRRIEYVGYGFLGGFLIGTLIK